MATKVAMLFSYKLHICTQYIGFYNPMKNSYLGQNVHVSEILRHFPQIYPTH